MSRPVAASPGDFVTIKIVELQLELGGVMGAKRESDPKSKPRFRNERFVQEGGKWFFYTRERTLEGPCEDRVDAAARLEKYLSVLESGLLPEEHELSLEPWAKEAG